MPAPPSEGSILCLRKSVMMAHDSNLDELRMIPSLWALLPRELVDKILDILQDCYDHDPAIQWMVVRHITSRSMKRIEHYFQRFWLTKMAITVWDLPLGPYDYYLESHPEGDEKHACFKSDYRQKQVDQQSAFFLEHQRCFLDNFSFHDRTVFIRLGEKEPLLNRGLPSGHITNDVDMEELRIDGDTIRIRFNWRRTFSNLFQEEIVMRTAEDRMIQKYIGGSDKVRQIRHLSVQEMRDLIPVLVSRIQFDRRTVAQRRRSILANPSQQMKSSFLLAPPTYKDLAEKSKDLPRYVREQSPEDDYCDCYDSEDEKNPTLADILRTEESLIFTLPGWMDLEDETLCDLMAEERTWRAYLRDRSSDTMAFYKERLRTYFREGMNEPPATVTDFRRKYRWSRFRV